MEEEKPTQLFRESWVALVPALLDEYPKRKVYDLLRNDLYLHL